MPVHSKSVRRDYRKRTHLLVTGVKRHECRAPSVPDKSKGRERNRLKKQNNIECATCLRAMSDTLAEPVSQPSVAKSTRRLLSLDALRGFDMFWIVGGEEVVHALYKAWPIGPLRLLDHQMDHTPWAGVTFYDLIFPLFVFIVGASLVFSLPRMIEREGKPAALRRVIVRSLLLYLLGVFYYGGLGNGVQGIRWMGVL